MKKKILSVGEATVDCFTFLSEDNVHVSMHHEKQELHLNFAEKIITEDLKFTVGGNAANTAVSFSRLGLDSYLYVVVGDDWVGDRIRRAMDREGVHDRYIMIEKGPTSYTTALVFQGERTLLLHAVPREYNLPKIEPVDWIYLTNLGRNFKGPYQQVLDFAKDCQAKIAFNPGTYQVKAGVNTLKASLRQTDILFVNKEEAQALTELPTSASIRKLSEALYDLGPKIVNITDGPKGSFAFDGQELLFCEVFPIEIVERTGTGDAYGAAFTAAIVNNLPVATAMRWGAGNSAGVVNKIGPEAGLLDDEQMVEMLTKNRRIVPVPVKD